MSTAYGINVCPVTYFGTDKAWVDLGRTFSQWGVGTVPWVTPAVVPPLTPDGYPTVPAWSCSGLIGEPAGTYNLSWTGTATLAFSGRTCKLGPVTKGPDGVSRADLNITGTAGSLVLAVTGLNPADPFGSLRLIRPNYDPVNPPIWTEDFLRRFGPFQVLRMMDWGCVNRTSQVEWADRVLPSDFLQTGPDGVAFESMIGLANTLDRDIWVCIPDQASDSYIRQMADLFRVLLSPDLNVYMECSNELWNTVFPQYGRNVAAAALDAVSFVAPVLTPGKPTPQDLRPPQRAAWKTYEAAAIWREEFGGDAGRIRPILSGQCTNAWWLTTGLNYLVSRGINPAATLYGIGVAPYLFNTPTVNRSTTATVDDLLADLQSQLAGPVQKGITAHAGLAAKYGLQLIAYEAGQSVVDFVGGLGIVNHSAKVAVQIDPRMGDLYRALAKTWAAAGGDLLCWYCGPAGSPDTQWGYFALLPSADAQGSVKWDAVLGLATVPGDVNLDGEVDYSDYLQIAANLGQPGFREQGDLDGDRQVGRSDVAAFLVDNPGLTDVQRATIAAATK